MRIFDMVTAAFGGAAARLRRDAILYALCAVCAAGIIVLTTVAAVIALESEVGLVYARLIVAGVYLIALIGLIVALRMGNGGRRPAARQYAAVDARARVEETQRSLQLAQWAMIVEAVMLGFSLSRRSGR